MAELDEAELTRLQDDAVAVMAASTNGNPKHALSPAAAAVVLAVPALCDEVRYYYDQAIAAQRRMEGLEEERTRLRAALRAARPHLEGGIEYPENSRDEVLEQVDAALGEPGAGAPDRRCENAGCGSGAWLTDDDECPACGWRAVMRNSGTYDA